MNMQTNRRGLLGAMALAPLMAVPAAVAAANPASDLDHLIAVWRAAEAASNPASDAHQAALDELAAAKAAVPHHMTKAGFMSQGNGFMHMTTADPTHPYTARTMLKVWSERKWKDGDAYVAVCRELVEADDRRQAEFARLARVHRIEQLCAEEERMTGIAADAMWAVYEHPVSCPSDLLKKLAVLEEQGAVEECAHLLADDIRRVLKGWLA